MRLSVLACSWVSAMIRCIPRRAPAWLASVWRSWTTRSSTSVPGAVVPWMTPTVRPMIATGTQTAPQRPWGRPRSLGHTPSSSLSAKRCTCDRRAAGHWSGESTLQPGGSPVGDATTIRFRCAWLLSASSTSSEVSDTVVVSARSTVSRTSGSLSAISSSLARWVSNSRRRASPFIWRSFAVLTAPLRIAFLVAMREKPTRTGTTRAVVTAATAIAGSRATTPTAHVMSAAARLITPTRVTPPTVVPRDERRTLSRAEARSISVTMMSRSSTIYSRPSGRPAVGWPAPESSTGARRRWRRFPPAPAGELRCSAAPYR